MPTNAPQALTAIRHHAGALGEHPGIARIGIEQCGHTIRMACAITHSYCVDRDVFDRLDCETHDPMLEGIDWGGIVQHIERETGYTLQATSLRNCTWRCQMVYAMDFSPAEDRTDAY